MKRLYLHAGYPKTGTTALQAFFQHNRAALAQHGILYPDTGRIGAAQYGLNFSIGVGHYDKMGEVLPPEELARALHAEADRTGLQEVLVSSEYFITARNAETVKELFAGFEVVVIVYLRRHDYAFESSYNQSVRSTNLPPWEPTIESFILYQLGLGTVPFDYLTVLRRWAATFGQANIIVRPFERGQNKPDLQTDFLNLLGIASAEGMTMPASQSNASLCADIMAAVDTVQRAPIPGAAKQKLVTSLIQMDQQFPRTSTALLPPPIRAAIVARYQHAYAAIAREFMGRGNGILFEEAAPSRIENWAPPAKISPQTVADLILRAATPHMVKD